MSVTGVQGKKRIKILLPIYGLEGGGAERIVTTLANHLDRSRFDPVLVLLHTKGEYRTELRSDVRVIELYEKSAPGERIKGDGKHVFINHAFIDVEEKGGEARRLGQRAGSAQIDSSMGKKGDPWFKGSLHKAIQLRRRIGNFLWVPRRRKLLTYFFEDQAVWMYILFHTKRLQAGFVKVIEAERPDVILSTLLLANYLTLRTGAMRGIYTAVCIHNTLKDYQVRVEFKKSPLEKADSIVAVSHGIGDVFREKYEEEKVRVIHNPHDIQKIQMLAGEEVADPWFANKTLPVVAGIGRLCYQKNFSLLIEAVGALNRTGRIDLRLVIFGEGPERDKLTKLIRRTGQQERIRIMGWVPNPFRYLAKADLFVLSSEWEGLPNTLIEAMACGVPVISTTCGGGPGEILEDEDCGILVPCGDKEGLEKAILSVLRDPHKAQTLREHGRKRAWAFDVSVRLPQYERLFIEGMEKKGRRTEKVSSSVRA